MQEAKNAFHGLDDWEVVCKALPQGWEEAARICGALRRTRQIKSAGELLRVLLVHMAGGCSLKETAAVIEEAGWCSLTPVALFKRLKNSGEWLRWMAERLWRQDADPGTVAPLAGRRVRAVDATVVKEQGQTGTNWRVHFSLRLEDLSCDYFELTDPKGGESFRRVPVRAGDLILGDRAYATPAGVAYVLEQGADVLVRLTCTNLPLFTPEGTALKVLARLRSLKVGQTGQWKACVHHDDKVYRGRMVAIKKGRRATAIARRRLKRDATRKQRKLSRQARVAAGYIFAFTSLPADVLNAKDAMELYRMRWQIELAFKRMKSLLGLGCLPKHTDPSARAWLQGKLLVALLIRKLLDLAENFSPWGYRLEAPPQRLA